MDCSTRNADYRSNSQSFIYSDQGFTAKNHQKAWSFSWCRRSGCYRGRQPSSRSVPRRPSRFHYRSKSFWSLEILGPFSVLAKKFTGREININIGGKGWPWCLIISKQSSATNNCWYHPSHMSVHVSLHQNYKQQSLDGPHVGNLYTTFYSLAVSNYITHKYGYWMCVGGGRCVIYICNGGVRTKKSSKARVR